VQQTEEVFQLQQQHWRLADASWCLVTLLQKAAATLASLGPQGPGLIRRLTPTSEGGSTKTRAALPLAGTAEQTGELVCVLEFARKGCCASRLQYACFIHCVHALDCKERLWLPACSVHASCVDNARKGCGTPSLHPSHLVLATNHKSLVSAFCSLHNKTFCFRSSYHSTVSRPRVYAQSLSLLSGLC